jgi:hypothetical protein
VFIGRRIETAVLLLLPVFVAVRMFMDIPLLLEKRPICHNNIGAIVHLIGFYLMLYGLNFLYFGDHRYKNYLKPNPNKYAVLKMTQCLQIDMYI